MHIEYGAEEFSNTRLVSKDFFVWHMVRFSPSNVVNIVARETYSLFELFGDIGGLFEFLKIAIGAFVAKFSSTKMFSLIGNRLYYWPKTEEFYAKEMNLPKRRRRLSRFYAELPLLKCLGF